MRYVEEYHPSTHADEITARPLHQRNVNQAVLRAAVWESLADRRSSQDVLCEELSFYGLIDTDDQGHPVKPNARRARIIASQQATLWRSLERDAPPEVLADYVLALRISQRWRDLADKATKPKLLRIFKSVGIVVNPNSSKVDLQARAMQEGKAWAYLIRAGGDHHCLHEALYPPEDYVTTVDQELAMSGVPLGEEQGWELQRQLPLPEAGVRPSTRVALAGLAVIILGTLGAITIALKPTEKPRRSSYAAADPNADLRGYGHFFGQEYKGPLVRPHTRLTPPDVGYSEWRDHTGRQTKRAAHHNSAVDEQTAQELHPPSPEAIARLNDVIRRAGTPDFPSPWEGTAAVILGVEDMAGIPPGYLLALTIFTSNLGLTGSDRGTYNFGHLAASSDNEYLANLRKGLGLDTRHTTHDGQRNYALAPGDWEVARERGIFDALLMMLMVLNAGQDGDGKKDFETLEQYAAALIKYMHTHDGPLDAQKLAQCMRETRAALNALVYENDDSDLVEVITRYRQQQVEQNLQIYP